MVVTRLLLGDDAPASPAPRPRGTHSANMSSGCLWGVRRQRVEHARRRASDAGWRPPRRAPPSTRLRRSIRVAKDPIVRARARAYDGEHVRARNPHAHARSLSPGAPCHHPWSTYRRSDRASSVDRSIAENATVQKLFQHARVAVSRKPSVGQCRSKATSTKIDRNFLSTSRLFEGEWLQISSQLSAKKNSVAASSGASGRFGFGLIGLIVVLCG